MKRKSSIPEEKLLPYETICAATRGDPDAMTEVLRHFDGYISYQATRIFYDEYGQSYRHLPIADPPAAVLLWSAGEAWWCF